MVDPGDLETPQATKFIVEDAPPLLERHVTKAGLLTAVARSSPADRFQGAQLLESVDGGTTWRSIQAYTGEGIMGHVTGTLGGGVTGHGWDTVNTLTVVLDHGEHELASESAEDVMAGRENMLLVGREIIGFRTATLTAERTYELTNLLRGRRDTHQFIDSHAAGERVLLLTHQGPIFVEMGFMPHHTTRKYKVVPNGQVADDVVEEIDLAIETESMKPFSPIIRPAYRDASDNVTIRWIRRSRSIFRLWSCVRAPINDCCHEEYEIIIWADEDREVVKRTIVVEDATEVVYTDSQQITDFGSTQAVLYVTIYQVSPIIGAGRAREAVI